MESKRSKTISTARKSDQNEFIQLKEEIKVNDNAVTKSQKKKRLDRVLLKLSNGQLISHFFSLLTRSDILNFLRVSSLFNQYFQIFAFAGVFVIEQNLGKIPKQIKLNKIKCMMKTIQSQNDFWEYLKSGNIPKVPSYLPKLTKENASVKIFLGNALGSYDKTVTTGENQIFCSRIYISYFEERKSLLIWEMYSDLTFQIIIELKLNVGDILKSVKVQQDRALVELQSDDDIDTNQTFYLLIISELNKYSEERIKSIRDVSHLGFLTEHNGGKKLDPSIKRIDLNKKMNYSKLTDKDIFLNCELPNFKISQAFIFYNSNIIGFIDSVLGIIILIDITTKEVFKNSNLPYISPLFGFKQYESRQKDFLLFSSMKDIYLLKLSKIQGELSSETISIELKEKMKTTSNLVPLFMSSNEIDESRFIIFDDSLWALFSFSLGLIYIKDMKNTYNSGILDIQTANSSIFIFIQKQEKDKESNEHLCQVLKVDPNTINISNQSIVVDTFKCDKGFIRRENKFCLLGQYGYILNYFECLGSTEFEISTQIRLFNSKFNQRNPSKQYIHKILLKNDTNPKLFKKSLTFSNGYLVSHILTEKSLTNRFTHILDFNLRFNIVMYSQKSNIREIYQSISQLNQTTFLKQFIPDFLNIHIKLLNTSKKSCLISLRDRNFG